MKKYLIIALLVGCTVPVVLAQQKNDKNKRTASELKIDDYSQRKANLLKSELQLTDAQTVKIQNIYKTTAPVRLGVHSKDGANISEMNLKENQEIQKVLTPEQLKKFNEKNEKFEVELKQQRELRSSRDRSTVDEPRTSLGADLEKGK